MAAEASAQSCKRQVGKLRADNNLTAAATTLPMKSSVSAQTQTVSTMTVRTIIESFDREFAQLDARARDLLKATPVEILYQAIGATEVGSTSTSVGELILKSAGVVEQTFGGLTSNLWDDPFEWTLPETLSTVALVMEYLDEVEQTRKSAFARFINDGDLVKLIAMPAGDAQPLVNLLLDTLVRAAGYQGRAAVILALLSSRRSPIV